MRTRAFILLGLILAARSGTALAEDNVDRVLPLLQGYEWHLDKERFAALPPETYRTLVAVAGSDRYAPFLRERAAVALSLYPNRDVLDFFVSSVRSEPEPVLRRGLVQPFCGAFARDDPAAVEGAVAPLLAESDAHLRVRAAKCLRTLGSATALERVDEYRARIRDAWEARATAPE